MRRSHANWSAHQGWHRQVPASVHRSEREREKHPAPTTPMVWNRAPKRRSMSCRSCSVSLSGVSRDRPELLLARACCKLSLKRKKGRIQMPCRCAGNRAAASDAWTCGCGQRVATGAPTCHRVLQRCQLALGPLVEQLHHHLLDKGGRKQRLCSSCTVNDGQPAGESCWLIAAATLADPLISTHMLHCLSCPQHCALKGMHPRHERAPPSGHGPAAGRASAQQTAGLWTRMEAGRGLFSWCIARSHSAKNLSTAPAALHHSQHHTHLRHATARPHGSAAAQLPPALPPGPLPQHQRQGQGCWAAAYCRLPPSPLFCPALPTQVGATQVGQRTHNVCCPGLSMLHPGTPYYAASNLHSVVQAFHHSVPLPYHPATVSRCYGVTLQCCHTAA